MFYTLIQPRKRRLLFIISFCLLAIGFYLLYARNKTPEKNLENKRGEPYEEFMLQRTYPNKTFDVHAYQSALISAKIKSGHQQRLSRADNWNLEGPGNIGGRFNCIAVSPNNPNVMYAGSANGGVWKTTNYGTDWTPVFDDIVYQAIGAISINPLDENEIWVGTGDLNISGTMYLGNGVYKSQDAGQTWSYVGLSNTFVVSSIIFNPVNTDEVLVATMGNSFSKDGNRGIYRTTDGGVNFSLVNFVNDSTGFIDMIQDPVSTSTIYASSFSRVRTDMASLTMGTEVYVYKSTDFGQTWNILTGGLPNGALHERLGIGLCKSSPSIIYALYSTSDSSTPELYKSVDGGASWSQVTIGFFDNFAYGTFGWYFGKIYVDPVFPDVIYIPGVDLQYSTDGGSNWNMRTPPWFLYEVHADGHFMHFTNSNEFIYCTDGGLSRTLDGGNTWSDIDNIPNNQFYSVTENKYNPGEYAGGVQDNGTMYNNTSGINNFIRLYGGDGFTVTYTGNPLLVYSESQYGNIVFDDDHPNGNWNSIDKDTAQNYNWHTPYILSPFSEDTLFFAGQTVMRIDGAPYGTFTSISPVLPDTASSERVQNISTINQSVLARDIIYAGTADGKVWNTLNGGVDWNDVTPFPGSRFYITQVKPSPNIVSNVYVTRSGYRSNDFTPLIYKSDNNGTTWQNISGDLPLLAVNDIEIFTGNENIIFIANDAGVYATINGGVNWERVGENMPYVAVLDIDFNVAQDKIIAGTFGRSMYSIDINNILLNAEQPVEEADFYIYPNPASENIFIRSTHDVDEITVYSSTGQLMTKSKSNSINISGYVSGTYILKIAGKKKTVVKRFLKI